MEYKSNLKWNIRPWACKPCFTVYVGDFLKSNK